MNQERLQILETLVEELLKDAPEESIVQRCLQQAGIPDGKDPMDRINKVLHALHPEDSEQEAGV